VIAGAVRGRLLRASAETRPTADLIKGVMFSMLEALAYKRDFEPDDEGNMAAALAWPRVLDLFAGSGALGIEALSRGAQSAEFVESDREAVRILEANLRATGLDAHTRIHQLALPAALRRLNGPFDAVFIDPPYADVDQLHQTWAALSDSDLVAPSAVVVLEQSARADPMPDTIALALHVTRQHGRTRVSLYVATTMT
jgi:16S rRNA (guanine966-N2)-methyltransferase